MTLFLQAKCKLRSRSCFARAVEAHNQNPRFVFQTKRLRIAAEQGSQFVIKNFNDLLAGCNAAQNCFP